MNPTLEATQTEADRYQITARPDNGPEVTLYVVPTTPEKRIIRTRSGRRYIAPPPKYQVKRDPDSLGLISEHRTFEAAAKSATHRAKRYVQLYGKKAPK